MGRIFISYRRDDAAFPAGWLFDRLNDHYRHDEIFKDVDSIEPGDDFHDRISAAVASCDVLLALIGPRWLDMTDKEGRRRLDDPDDLVRFEIEVALKRDIRVVPVLIDGARMPEPAELPASLSPLTRRHAVALGSARFADDVEQLLTVLQRMFADRPTSPPPPRRAGTRVSRRTVLAVASVALLAVIGVGLVTLVGRSENDTVPTTTPATAPVSVPPPTVTPATTAPLGTVAPHPQHFVVFRLCELGPACAIKLFAAADDGAAQVGSVDSGEQVLVQCQGEGPFTDPQGDRRTVVWDRLDGGRWIPDPYVFTGQDGFLPSLPRC